MRAVRGACGVVAMVVALFCARQTLDAQAQPSGIRWDFDEASGASIHDSIGNMDDTVEGFSWRAPGVEGNGLQFDGYTTRILRAAGKVPQLKGGFSVSAWVALEYYPWNWVPIADQDADDQIGFFFGIDAFGHPGFNLAVDGVWRQLTSPVALSARRYSRVTATFDPHSGMALYVDGKPAGKPGREGRVQSGNGNRPESRWEGYALRSNPIRRGWISSRIR